MTPAYILAIDPGTEMSGVVTWDVLSGKIISAFLCDNVTLLQMLRTRIAAQTALLIEDIENYGMPMGQTTIQTIRWTGRFQEAWDSRPETTAPGDMPMQYVTRRSVKLRLCGTSRAKDQNVNAALFNRFGGDRKAAIGTKQVPGPLYGCTGHTLSALAVAVSWLEEQREKESARAAGEQDRKIIPGGAPPKESEL